MQLEIAVKSDVGRVRRGNEDNFLLLNIESEQFETGGSSQVSAEFPIHGQGKNGVVLAVSDGMGGALAGEVASQMAVEIVRDILLEQDPEITLAPEAKESLVKQLYFATLQANRQIHRKGRTDPQFNGMGATFTCAALVGDEVFILQIGDSRAYLLRGNNIHQVTKDQSLVQQLIDSHQILPEEAERHALRNVILQALGAQSEIYPIGIVFEPRRDDVLLLCSDGLSNKLPANDLLDIVKRFGNDLSKTCDELVREANNRGGEDNITVILARFKGDDLPVSDSKEINIQPLLFEES